MAQFQLVNEVHSLACCKNILTAGEAVFNEGTAKAKSRITAGTNDIPKLAQAIVTKSALVSESVTPLILAKTLSSKLMSVALPFWLKDN